MVTAQRLRCKAPFDRCTSRVERQRWTIMWSGRSAALCACGPTCSVALSVPCVSACMKFYCRVVVHEEFVQCIQSSRRHAPMSSTFTSAVGTVNAYTPHPDVPAMVYTVHTHNVRLAELYINYSSTTYHTQQLAPRMVPQTLVFYTSIVCSAAVCRHKKTVGSLASGRQWAT